MDGAPTIRQIKRGQRLRDAPLADNVAYATRVSALREQNLVRTNPTAVVPMSHEKSVGIDEPIDWVVAESIGNISGFKPLPI